MLLWWSNYGWSGFAVLCSARGRAMIDQKVYFSKLFDPTDWSYADDFLTFYLIPNKWWSIRAWKFANSMRSRILNKMVERIQP